jgi:hypothetical protein
MSHTLPILLLPLWRNAALWHHDKHQESPLSVAGLRDCLGFEPPVEVM